MHRGYFPKHALCGTACNFNVFINATFKGLSYLSSNGVSRHEESTVTHREGQGCESFERGPSRFGYRCAGETGCRNSLKNWG